MTAKLAFFFPGVVEVSSYEELVGLTQWQEWSRAQRVSELVDALRIAHGRAKFPSQWIRLLSESPEEESQWRTDEFQRSQTAPGPQA